VSYPTTPLALRFHASQRTRSASSVDVCSACWRAIKVLSILVGLLLSPAKAGKPGASLTTSPSAQPDESRRAHLTSGRTACSQRAEGREQAYRECRAPQHAGLRVCEVVALKAGDIDSKRMLLRVERGKRRKDRHAMLSPQLLEVLREWWPEGRRLGALLPRGWLFPGRNPVEPLSTRN
jgi:site-specific recombinase XerC